MALEVITDCLELTALELTALALCLELTALELMAAVVLCLELMALALCFELALLLFAAELVDTLAAAVVAVFDNDKLSDLDVELLAASLELLTSSEVLLVVISTLLTVDDERVSSVADTAVALVDKEEAVVLPPAVSFETALVAVLALAAVKT